MKVITRQYLKKKLTSLTKKFIEPRIRKILTKFGGENEVDKLKYKLSKIK